MASRFQLVPTKNPTEFMVAVTVPDQIVNDHMALQPGGDLLTLYTPYNQFYWLVTPPRVGEFGSYLYVHSEKPGAGETTFYFAKPKTEAEKRTPFRTFYDQHSYVWPEVILELSLIKTTVYNAAIFGVAQESYYPRIKKVPRTPYSSTIRIEQFLSPTPWSQADLSHEQPVASDVQTSFFGVNISLNQCLHQKIAFPQLIAGGSVVLNAGTEGAGQYGTPQEQVFPATNFTDWQAFYLRDGQQQINGAWFRERVKVYPPPRAEPIQK